MTEQKKYLDPQGAERLTTKLLGEIDETNATVEEVRTMVENDPSPTSVTWPLKLKDKKLNIDPDYPGIIEWPIVLESIPPKYANAFDFPWYDSMPTSLEDIVSYSYYFEPNSHYSDTLSQFILRVHITIDGTGLFPWDGDMTTFDAVIPCAFLKLDNWYYRVIHDPFFSALVEETCCFGLAIYPWSGHGINGNPATLERLYVAMFKIGDVYTYEEFGLSFDVNAELFRIADSSE